MRTTILALAVAATFLFTPATLATTQNDAGSGGDAPDSSHPLSIANGATYTGSTLYGQGDLEDWYRVTIPAGATLRIQWHATDGCLWGGLYHASDGSFITNAFSCGVTNWIVFGAGSYNLGFGDNSRTTGSASYSFIVSAACAAGGQNDAGSGCDAGDDSAHPIELPLGNYAGELRYGSGDKADWYRISPICSGIDAWVRNTGSAGFSAGIYRDDGSLVQTTAVPPGGLVQYTLAYAGPFRIGIGDAGASTGSTTYSLETSQYTQSDGGSGCDAGDDAAHAMSVPSGNMIAGTTDYAHGDHADWYVLPAAECTHWIVEFHTSAGATWGRAYDANGIPLAQAHASDTPQILTVTTGTLYLSFGDADDFTTSATYTFTAEPIPDASGLCPVPANAAIPGTDL